MSTESPKQARVPNAAAQPNRGGDDAEPQPNRWLILIAMTGSLSMIMLDQTVVTVALPSMARELPLSASGQQWVVNAYVLALAALVAFGGKLGDVIGRLTTFKAGVVVFFVASLGCGLVPQGEYAEAGIIVFRAAQGIGAALMTPVSGTIVMSAFPVAERGKAMAMYAGISQVFLAVGPLLGGFLTEYVTWRAVFWLNVPVGLAALLLVRIATPPNLKSASTLIRVRDVSLLAAGIGLTVFAVQESSQWTWTSPLTLGTLLLGLGLTTTFVLIQLRATDPLIDVTLFGRRGFLGDNVVMGLVQFGLLAVVLFSSLYSQDLLQFSPAQAGLSALPLILPITVAAQFGGRWYDRAGVRLPVLAGLLICVVGLAAWTVALPQLSYGWLVPGMVLTGFGLGLTISPTNTDGLSQVSEQARGQASGLIQTVRQVGGTLGVGVIGAVILGREPGGSRSPNAQQAADAIQSGFAVATAAFTLALLAAWWLLSRERPQRAERTPEGLVA